MFCGCPAGGLLVRFVRIRGSELHRAVVVAGGVALVFVHDRVECAIQAEYFRFLVQHGFRSPFAELTYTQPVWVEFFARSPRGVSHSKP